MGKLVKLGTLSIGCVAAWVLMAAAVPAQAKWLTIHNDFTMYDTDGNPNSDSDRHAHSDSVTESDSRRGTGR